MEKDVKNLPHYTQFKVQPIEFFRANKGILDFLQMSAIKYICRYKMKNGKEDLLKAKNYLEMMIEDWDKENPPAKVEEPYHSPFVPAGPPQALLDPAGSYDKVPIARKCTECQGNHPWHFGHCSRLPKTH